MAKNMENILLMYTNICSFSSYICLSFSKVQTSVEIPPTLVSSRDISRKVGRAFYVIANASWYGHVYGTSLWMTTIININNLYLFASLFKPICLSWVQLHSHSCSFMLRKSRVPTRPGKPGKMRVHLENLEISWNFEKFNKYHRKMASNLEKLGGY